MSAAPLYDVVIPTVGRPSLARLLDALARQADPLRGRVIVADDRRGGGAAAPLIPAAREVPPLGGAAGVEVVRAGGRGPAAARNAGWRLATAPWIVFLDDDVLPSEGWSTELRLDLARASDDVGGVQGRIRVPLPGERRATDWERNVAGLERARWATADLAYRRSALEAVGGFDERFRRNYREDADLGLRVVGAGWRIERGAREIVHPVGLAGAWTSVRLQRGNADDVLMRRLHGPGWRAAADAPAGRGSRHLAVAGAGVAAVSLGAAALAASAAGERRAGRGVARAARLGAGAAGAAWLAGTAELAWARIAPGPRTPKELLTMVATSAAMPFAATYWRAVGAVRHARAEPLVAAPGRGDGGPLAILFDRDGTLVEDVPYNGDPSLVELRPGAFDAVSSVREAGLLTAIVSNQSGIARGLLTAGQVDCVNARVDELLGGIGPQLVCPHGPADGCDCRKPAPGLVLAAARELGVTPERCVVIGDIGADVEAARAAGARGVLVPTPATRREEIDAAAEVAPDLLTAVRLILADVPPDPAPPAETSRTGSGPAAEAAPPAEAAR